MRRADVASRRTVTRPAILPALLAVLLLAVVAACSQPPDQPTASTDSPIVAMLAAVPATGSLDIVTATDFAAAQRIAGIEPADQSDDPAEWLERLEAATRFWPVGFGGTYADQQGWLDAFGFSLGTVTAALEAGVPNDEVKVFAGIDPDAVEDAIGRDEAWRQARTRRQLRGGLLFDWGDGRRDNATNATRTAGEAGQLLIRGDLAIRTTASTTMNEVVDGLTTNNTLADDPVVMSVVDQLLDTALLDADQPESGESDNAGANGVYSLLLSNRLITTDAGADDPTRTTVRLTPYVLLGIGLGRVDDRFVGVIVLAHDTPKAAAANFDAFGRILAEGRSRTSGERWSDTMTIRSAQVSGNLVTFVLEPDKPDGPVEAFLRQDSLFWTTPSY